MKISHRITLFSTIMMFLLLLVVNTSIYFLFQHYTLNAELDRTLSQSRVITEAMQPSTPEWSPADYLEAYVSADGMVRVVRENGEVAVSATKTPQLVNAFSPQFMTEESTHRLVLEGQSYAVARTPVIWENGALATLELYEPMTMYEETSGILGIILIIASLMILIPSYFAGRSLSRFILRPIQALVATMNHIRAERTFKKIDVDDKSKDELAEMGKTFNHMIDLLKENYDKQQQFVSDASHELKTPLTVIDSYAQLLKRWGKQKPDVLDEAVSAIASESTRIKEMTNQMLALATGEDTITMNLERVNLTDTMFETAKQMETAYNRDIRVHTSGNGSTFILGNHMQLKQLAFILLENGMKYSDQELLVNVERKSNKVVIRVRDYGIGIDKEDIPHVFDRFFRVDKARSRKTGGSGLGLSIAKKIVDVHHGTILIESEPDKGTTFIVHFPALEKED
jgi:signal transduction histidine kinase